LEKLVLQVKQVQPVQQAQEVFENLVLPA